MSFFSHPLQVTLGFIIWSLWFIFMYGLLSVSCEISSKTLLQPVNWINLLLLAMTILVLLMLMYLTYGCWKNCRFVDARTKVNHFLIWLSLGGYLVAIGATFSMGMMILLFPPCV